MRKAWLMIDFKPCRLDIIECDSVSMSTLEMSCSAWLVKPASWWRAWCDRTKAKLKGHAALKFWIYESVPVFGAGRCDAHKNAADQLADTMRRENAPARSPLCCDRVLFWRLVRRTWHDILGYATSCFVNEVGTAFKKHAVFFFCIECMMICPLTASPQRNASSLQQGSPGQTITHVQKQSCIRDTPRKWFCHRHAFCFRRHALTHNKTFRPLKKQRKNNDLI